MADAVTYYPMKVGGVELTYPNVHPGAGKFAAGVAVGNLLFLSGMTAQSEEDGSCLAGTIEEQVTACLDKLRLHLEEMGSSLDNVVKDIIILKNVEHYQRMRAAELAYYQKHAPRLVREPPASTVFQPATLARPEYLVEWDAIAVKSRE